MSMSMPGFTAEAAHSRTTLHYHSEATDRPHEPLGVMPQQFEHPSFTISCSSCLLRYVPGSFQPWQWRESLRTCFYKANPFHQRVDLTSVDHALNSVVPRSSRWIDLLSP